MANEDLKISSANFQGQPFGPPLGPSISSVFQFSAFKIPDQDIVKPEQIVRPAQSWQERYDQRVAELNAPPGTEEEDPELCIGGEFAESGLVPDPTGQQELLGNGGFQIKTKDAPEEEEPKEPPQYEWREQSRKTKKIRVENPDDADQYVIIERIEEMEMTAPSPDPFNGAKHTWFFKNR